MLLFAKNGYAGVSMRDLASSVGLGVSAIYHHFPDKTSGWCLIFGLVVDGRRNYADH